MPEPFSTSPEPFIVHEDGRFLAVWKPAGMHTAPGGEGGSLAAWVFSRFPEVAAAGDALAERAPPAAPLRDPAEGGLLHRLDRETSGLVLFARDPACLGFLLAEQAAGLIRKDYRLAAAPSPALMPGARPERGRVEEGAIESRFRPYGPRGSRVACLAPAAPPGGGRAARAAADAPLYRTELLGEDEASAMALSLPAPGARLFRVRILKGFRHQIRAHFAWIGLPIIGDTLYGGAPASRLHLEAFALEFREPGGRERRVALADIDFPPGLR